MTRKHLRAHLEITAPGSGLGSSTGCRGTCLLPSLMMHIRQLAISDLVLPKPSTHGPWGRAEEEGKDGGETALRAGCAAGWSLTNHLFARVTAVRALRAVTLWQGIFPQQIHPRTGRWH